MSNVSALGSWSLGLLLIIIIKCFIYIASYPRSRTLYKIHQFNTNEYIVTKYIFVRHLLRTRGRMQLNEIVNRKTKLYLKYNTYNTLTRLFSVLQTILILLVYSTTLSSPLAPSNPHHLILAFYWQHLGNYRTTCRKGADSHLGNFCPVQPF